MAGLDLLKASSFQSPYLKIEVLFCCLQEKKEHKSSKPAHGSAAAAPEVGDRWEIESPSAAESGIKLESLPVATKGKESAVQQSSKVANGVAKGHVMSRLGGSKQDGGSTRFVLGLHFVYFQLSARRLCVLCFCLGRLCFPLCIVLNVVKASYGVVAILCSLFLVTGFWFLVSWCANLVFHCVCSVVYQFLPEFVVNIVVPFFSPVLASCFWQV